MLDSSGICWPVMPEDNPNLTSPDPALRFEAIMLKNHMCVEIYGLIRRSALERTSLLGGYASADKVVLTQLSLLGPYWLARSFPSPEFALALGFAPRAVEATAAGAQPSA